MDYNGRIAATVTYYADAAQEGLGLPGGWSGFRTLAVHPLARGLGFGRRLMDLCIERACRGGALSMGIHTAAFMERACGMYERAGFVRCLQASGVLGFDPALGDVLVTAYELPLPAGRGAAQPQPDASGAAPSPPLRMRRQVAGGAPTSFLKARLKEASDS